jgi:DNA (cytosine-5)-methyltransferase 1
MSKTFTSVEFFAGAGGSALGLEMAGFKHRALIERDSDACSTLKQNRPQWAVVENDIKDVQFRNTTVDLVSAGFPCQPFSVAGNARGFKDSRGGLFYDLMAKVEQLNPKMILLENVRGLMGHDAGKTLQRMLSILDSAGYRTEYKLLYAHLHCVPQKRERLIMIAVKKESDYAINFPSRSERVVTLRDALANVPNSIGLQYNGYKSNIMKRVPPGGNWKALPEDIQREYMGTMYGAGGGQTGVARRLSWDQPSLTLTCAPAQKRTERCHPEETRPLTVREYARIQTFPDDWQFAGSINSQYRQIGNALPVDLAYQIGLCLISTLKD